MKDRAIRAVADNLALEEERDRFVALAENSADLIAMASLDGKIEYVNSGGCALVGWEGKECPASLDLAAFVTQETFTQLHEVIIPHVLRHDRWEGELQLLHQRTGRILDVAVSVFLVRHPQTAAPLCIATIQRDISQQKWLDNLVQQQIQLVQEQRLELEQANMQLAEANARLQDLATTDGLTGLKNHRAFQDTLALEVHRNLRYSRPLSLIMLDVDRFKAFNDTFGHPAGDGVLKKVAMLLQRSVRASDFVARYGGEEFVIILTETGAESAMDVAERIGLAIAEYPWEQRAITVSIGVSTLRAATEGPATLLEEADEALYVSKERGRNRVVHYATLMPTSPGPLSHAVGEGES